MTQTGNCKKTNQQPVYLRPPACFYSPALATWQAKVTKRSYSHRPAHQSLRKKVTAVSSIGSFNKEACASPSLPSTAAVGDSRSAHRKSASRAMCSALVAPFFSYLGYGLNHEPLNTPKP